MSNAGIIARNVTDRQSIALSFDNAHTSIVAMAKIYEFNFELLSHSTYVHN